MRAIRSILTAKAAAALQAYDHDVCPTALARRSVLPCKRILYPVCLLLPFQDVQMVGPLRSATALGHDSSGPTTMALRRSISGTLADPGH